MMSKEERNDQNSPWWEIIVENFDTERLSSLLFDFGIQGTVGTLEGKTSCYFHGSENQLTSVVSQFSTLGLNPIKVQKVPQENWVQKCQEVWTPVLAGSFSVQPVIDAGAEATHSSAHFSLRIIPGSGFGTGHHSSTSMVLRLLSGLEHLTPRRILDVGTGSGILALCAARMFSVPVDALEIDPLALSNARENLAANKFTKQVNLIQGTVDSVSGHYDLILSNLYAELHIEYRSRYVQLLSDRGALLLSGIASSKMDEIKDSFARMSLPLSMFLEASMEGEGWGALLYTITR